jgi:hypothetical protein
MKFNGTSGEWQIKAGATSDAARKAGVRQKKAGFLGGKVNVRLLTSGRNFVKALRTLVPCRPNSPASRRPSVLRSLTSNDNRLEDRCQAPRPN